MKVTKMLSSAWGKSNPFAMLVRQAGFAVAIVCGVALCSPVRLLHAADTNSTERTLQGRLLFIKGTGPVVKTARKQYPLAGRNKYVFATLEDKRLRDDEVRLKGKMRADGNFQVDDLYTIHHGELYRIQYYCETCNIVGLGPGRCVCCQQPTELQEIPLNKKDKKILITH